MTTATQSVQDLMKVNLNELKTSEIKEHLQAVNEAFNEIDTELAPVRREYNALKSERFSLQIKSMTKFLKEKVVVELEDRMEPLAEKINKLVSLRNQLVDHRGWTEEFISHREQCKADRERRIVAAKARIRETTNVEEKRQLREDIKKHEKAVKRLEL